MESFQQTTSIPGKIIILMVKLIFPVVGLILMYQGWNSYNVQQSFIKNSVPVPGIVVKNIQHYGHDGPDYTPVVNFKTLDGQTEQYTSSISSYPQEYADGAHVQIFYDPQNPVDARIKSDVDLWFPVGMYAGMGLIFFIVGMIFFFQKSY